MLKNKKHLSPSGLAGLAFVVVISLVVIRCLLTKSFILGIAPYWQTGAEDITQYFVGFNRYLEAPWQLPLLYFNSINYPEGTTATFLDAIPLYALILKIIIPKSFLPLNPYGVWVAMSFVLQGVGAWWITRELRVRSWVFLLSLAVLLLLSPTLMGRLGHISLMSHWVLLFGLALYIRGYREAKLPVGLWSLLLLMTFYINIYLVVMISGVYLASMLTIGIRQNPRVVLLFFIPYVLIFLSMLIMLLPLPPTEVSRESGFGLYSMNLLAPFIGGTIIELQASVAPGQYEGFNYLGLGVIVLFALALWHGYYRDRPLYKRHGYFLCLLLIYTVFALSNKIYVGETLVATIKYPLLLDPLTSQFRSSGRFFWLVGYSIVIFSLLTLYRYVKTLVFIPVVLLLTLLQIYDLEGHFQTLAAFVYTEEPVDYVDYDKWDQALPDTLEHLYFYPKFKCSKGRPQRSLLPTMKYAALRDYTLNTGYVSRYTPRCDQVAEEIAESTFSNSAYVFVKKDFETIENVMSYFPPDITISCEEIDFAFLCQKPM